MKLLTALVAFAGIFLAGCGSDSPTPTRQSGNSLVNERDLAGGAALDKFYQEAKADYATRKAAAVAAGAASSSSYNSYPSALSSRANSVPSATSTPSAASKGAGNSAAIALILGGGAIFGKEIVEGAKELAGALNFGSKTDQAKTPSSKDASKEKEKEKELASKEADESKESASPKGSGEQAKRTPKDPEEKPLADLKVCDKPGEVSRSAKDWVDIFSSAGKENS